MRRLRPVPVVLAMGVGSVFGLPGSDTLIAQEASDSNPSEEDQPSVPLPYSGEWEGVSGQVSLEEKGHVGAALLSVDIGSIIDGFHFEISEDGEISGAGSATYWYNTSAEVPDAEAPGGTGTPDIGGAARLEGGKQSVNFSIRGKVKCEEKVAADAIEESDGTGNPLPEFDCFVEEIWAEPERDLILITPPNERSTIDAWNVFGPVVEWPIRRADHYPPMLSINVSGTVNGGMVVSWLAIKEACDRDMVNLLEEYKSEYDELSQDAVDDWQMTRHDIEDIRKSYSAIVTRAIDAAGEMLMGEVGDQIFEELPKDVQAVIRGWRGSGRMSSGNTLGGMLDLINVITYLAGEHAVELAKGGLKQAKRIADFKSILEIIAETLKASESDRKYVDLLAPTILEGLHLAEDTTAKAWDHYEVSLATQRRWCPHRPNLRPPHYPHWSKDIAALEMPIRALWGFAGLEDSPRHRRALQYIHEYFKEYERIDARFADRKQRNAAGQYGG